MFHVQTLKWFDVLKNWNDFPFIQTLRRYLSDMRYVMYVQTFIEFYLYLSVKLFGNCLTLILLSFKSYKIINTETCENRTEQLSVGVKPDNTQMEDSNWMLLCVWQSNRYEFIPQQPRHRHGQRQSISYSDMFIIYVVKVDGALRFIINNNNLPICVMVFQVEHKMKSAKYSKHEQFFHPFVCYWHAFFSSSQLSCRLWQYAIIWCPQYRNGDGCGTISLKW